MRLLESKCGILQEHDNEHLTRIERTHVDGPKFFESADELADEITPILFKEVIPHLEEYSGKWNPGGFMVFPLGTREGLGPVRLHVYPKGFSRITSQGPNIHNHAWHLYSKVLTGLYTDTLYQLHYEGKRESETNLRPHGLLDLFETRRNPGGKDTLISDGTLVRPQIVQQRKVVTGKFHTIEAEKVYHLTNVPATDLVATLVIDSFAFAETTHVLLNNYQGEEIKRVRVPLTEAETIEAKKQLCNAFGLN